MASVPTIDRMKVLRLIENLTLGTAAVGYRTESMHGAGSLRHKNYDKQTV